MEESWTDLEEVELFGEDLAFVDVEREAVAVEVERQHPVELVGQLPDRLRHLFRHRTLPRLHLLLVRQYACTYTRILFDNIIRHMLTTYIFIYKETVPLINIKGSKNVTKIKKRNEKRKARYQRGR
jgi:hypothetical protein